MAKQMKDAAVLLAVVDLAGKYVRVLEK